MRSSLPKVLHPVCGRPMVAWPVLAAREAGAERVAVIVSPDRDLTPGLPEGTETVIQPEADGTGGAIRAAHDIVRDSETVVVLSGDHPLINAEIVAALLETHRAAGAGATVMTVELDDPAAYGRIVRDGDGDIERIVETKDPDEVDPEVLAIREINTGTYAFAAEPLIEALDQLDNDNSAGEYYLGDVLPMLRDATACGSSPTAPPTRTSTSASTTAPTSPSSPPRPAARSCTATCSPASRSSTPARPGSTPRSRSPPTRRSSPAPPCAARPRDRRRLDHRPAHDPDRHPVGEQARVTALLPRRRRGRRPRRRSGRSPTCGPAPSSARARRPAPSSRSRTRGSARAPRSRTSPTSATPRSGAGANVGAGRDHRQLRRPRTSTRRRSGKVRGSRSTPRSSLRSTVGDGAYTGAGAVIREDVPDGALGVSTQRAAQHRGVRGAEGERRRSGAPRTSD